MEIASSCLEAGEAGASIVHVHVRDPATGRPSMNLALYREVVDRIRQKNTELIINLTTGPGGRYHPSDEDPAVAGPRTNLLRPEARLEHVVALRPDICSLDFNTMNFGGEVVINTPRSVACMAEIIYASNVKPEFELFDSGDVALMLDLIERGTLKTPGLASLVLGVRYGFPPSTRSMSFAKDLLPGGMIWSGFGIGRHAFPMLVQAFLLGGNVRIGMEDTVHVGKGQLACSNAELVDKACWMVRQLGGEIAAASETRTVLGLQ